MTGLYKLFQQKIFRRFGTVTFVAAIALSSLAVSVQAAQLTVSESVSPRRQAAAVAFWTRERIAAAPALALPVDRGPRAGSMPPPWMSRTSSARGAARPPAWPSVMQPRSPGRSTGGIGRPWKRKRSSRWRRSSRWMYQPTKWPARLGVYTFYDVNTITALWNIYPHRWDGKFTFTTPSGGASCSATVISGNNIVTAAHCVYDTPSRNQFYTNKVFTPAYRNGSAPFGTFATTTCSVLTAWVNLSGGFSINTWSRHDVAVCTLGKNCCGANDQSGGRLGRPVVERRQ